MVQHFQGHPEVTHGYLCARLLLFCGRRPLPFGGSHLCARLQPAHVTNDGYNETEELTMQSARPVREEWQLIHMSHLYQGEFFFPPIWPIALVPASRREFGHWKVSEGPDTFAFRHPSLALPDVCQLLDSEAHHHKVCPIGTGRLTASVGVSRPKM